MNLRQPSIIIYFLIILVAVLFDQLSKYFIGQMFETREQVIIVPKFLNLALSHNTGGAFGMLKGQRIFFIIVSIFLMFIIGGIFVKLKNENKLFYIALSLQLSGALGNFIDRIRYSYVVDFIDCYLGKYHWPTFNIADFFIVVGTFLLLYSLSKREQTKD